MTRVLLALLFMLPLSSCLAASVVGAAVDVTGAVVSTGVKTTGAVVGAVLPGDDDDDDDDDDDRQSQER
jgi:hypothetical protein